jgi:hypothetical protein
MARKKTPIRYTSRDFNSIKQDLLEYARRYYPNTFKDFNEASFGSLMMDTVSYVGDILSFYLDYQVNESFLDTAIEYGNVIKHGRELGYKFRGNPSSFGTETFYVIVPAKSAGLGPDPAYIPILLKGSELSSTSRNGYVVNENVDFSNPNNEVVVAEVDEDTGVPISYAIKAKGQIISGELVEEIIPVGEYEEFKRIELSGENIAEIISCVDSEGHEYFEVDYLSQNVIYTSVINRGEDKDTVPAILKPVIVARRFILVQEQDTSYLQFGYGSQEEIKLSSVADPSQVVLQVHGKDYTVDDSFDPSKLLSTDKFGVAPSNTTLRVVYRKNTSENVNAAVDTITEVANSNFQFENIVNLNEAKVSSVINSLEVTNEDPIVGDVSLPGSTELKHRMLDTFATQNRAVVKEDYISVVYNMPPQYGAIKRVNIVQDKDSFKRNLNMYIVSEDEDGTLTEAPDALKNNLKTWLVRNKMINDTIDILDARIVNIGIEFEAIAEYEQNKYILINDATQKLIELFENKQQIGEPFSITQIYTALNDVDGISDTVSVKVVQKKGQLYSDIRFDIKEQTSADGRYISVPENLILEIKYPKLDIKGTVK